MRTENCRLCNEDVPRDSSGRRFFCSKHCYLEFAKVRQRVKRQRRQYEIIMEGNVILEGQTIQCKECGIDIVNPHMHTKYCEKCKLIVRKRRTTIAWKKRQAKERGEAVENNANKHKPIDPKWLVRGEIK